MAKTIKDTDYLVISARVKALETGLLTRERMEQLLDVRTGGEAAKFLQEWGYPQLDPDRPEAMDAALSAAREATLADLAEGLPDPRYLDLFKIKYDYHNAKALLKAEVTGVSADRMLMDMGRIPAAGLAEAVRERDTENLPGALPAAVAEAREVLDTTRDPQLADIVLDRWCYRDMAELAAETGSAFLQGYVAAQVGVGDTAVQYGAYIAGFACLLGHVFPVYFGFRGGKGVVTSAAMMALIDWRVFVIVFLTFAIVFALKKIVSLGSVLAACVYPVATFLITFFFDYKMQFLSMVSQANLTYVVISTVLSLLIGLTVIILHRANIKRLLAGEEKQISFSGPKNG